MKIMRINVQSDAFQQIKPAHLSELRELVESGSKHSPCRFLRGMVVPTSPKPKEIWAAYYLDFSNQQVYDLLTKAVNIVKDTEEYVQYQLSSAFVVENKNKHYSTPPGTLRFYSRNLICFWNGKTWRKITP
jgi:hypothetical protein